MNQADHQAAHQQDLRDVARLIEPTMRVVSISNPEPTLAPLNVVAVYRLENDARNAVLALESMEADDGSVGLTVLGREDDPAFVTNETADDAEIRGLDPEGVTADIIPRALKGAVVGAMIGAVLVGGAAALIDGASGAIAGVLGGLLFGAVIGAVWGAFVRMGGSDAYRETFVEPNVTELMLVSLHTADGAHAERARQALAANADRPPYVVRADEHGIELISAH
jgi:hypothetical protein